MHKNTLRAQVVREKLFENNYTKMHQYYNELFNDDLSLSALKRYCGSGSGYERGAKSKQFQRFIDGMYKLI